MHRCTRPCLSSVLLDSVPHGLLHAKINNSWQLFLSIFPNFKFLSLNFLKYISNFNALLGNLCVHAISTCVELKRQFARVGSFHPWWLSGSNLRLLRVAAGSTTPSGTASSICTISDNPGIEHLNLIVFCFLSTLYLGWCSYWFLGGPIYKYLVNFWCCCALWTYVHSAEGFVVLFVCYIKILLKSKAKIYQDTMPN